MGLIKFFSFVHSFSVGLSIYWVHVCVLCAGLWAVSSWRWPQSWWWTLQVSGARDTLQRSEEPAGPSSATTTCRRSCWSTTTLTPSHTRWTDMHRYTGVGKALTNPIRQPIFVFVCLFILYNDQSVPGVSQTVLIFYTAWTLYTHKNK